MTSASSREPGVVRVPVQGLVDGEIQVAELRRCITWERMNEVLDYLENVCREDQASRDRHEPRNAGCDCFDLGNGNRH